LTPHISCPSRWAIGHENLEPIASTVSRWPAPSPRYKTTTRYHQRLPAHPCLTAEWNAPSDQQRNPYALELQRHVTSQHHSALHASDGAARSGRASRLVSARSPVQSSSMHSWLMALQPIGAVGAVCRRYRPMQGIRALCHGPRRHRGRVGDIHGSNIVFLVGLTGFTVASLCCGFARSRPKCAGPRASTSPPR
jgi:hypothetical protein